MARILIVDDDHDIRELSRALLTIAGHDVLLSDSAINALQVLRREKIHMLITDANMPNLSGFDLLKMIRLDGSHQNLSIVMLTGRRERGDVEAAKEAGVHEYIVKPIDPQIFVQKIAALLDRRPVSASGDEFPSVRVNTKANATLSVDLRTISELGLLVRTAHELKPGSLLHIDCETFAEIGIPSQDVRVFISAEKDGQWETRLSFVSLDPRLAKRIREWIEKNIRRSTRVA